MLAAPGLHLVRVEQHLEFNQQGFFLPVETDQALVPRTRVFVRVFSFYLEETYHLARVCLRCHRPCFYGGVPSCFVIPDDAAVFLRAPHLHVDSHHPLAPARFLELAGDRRYSSTGRRGPT